MFHPKSKASNTPAGKIINATTLEKIAPHTQLNILPNTIVTPLARQVALERNITLTNQPTNHQTNPLTNQPTLALGADHGGNTLKEQIKPTIQAAGFQIIDCGTNSKDSEDYPDIAYAVARHVADGTAQWGIIIDGTGIGSCMTANKIPGLRAALCYNQLTAADSREHNHANVLTLGAELIGSNLAKQIVQTWLTTDFGSGPHTRPFKQITRIEQPLKNGFFSRAAQNQKNKHTVWEFWNALETSSGDRIKTVARDYLDANVIWNGFDPVNKLHGVEGFMTEFWLPLLRSFPDLNRQSHLFFGGKSNGRNDGLRDGHMWVCGTGYMNGTFVRDYMTIPATAGQVNIRWGEFCRLEQGRIVEIYFLLDLIDLMQQAGVHVLPPSLGKVGVFPPPRGRDGILLDMQDEFESQRSLDHIRQFIFDGLNSYDESDLESMGMANFFHPDVQWYGPGGIGALLNFQDFQNLHQRPWLHAFPDRQIQDLDALIAEGSYSGAPGWKGVKATHTGEYLGRPPTNNLVETNGLDFWKREGEQYVENWVFVDMIDLFRQLGIDLFERLERQVVVV